MRSSHTYDISFPQVANMNGIMTRRVHDWVALLVECMYEFMTLQYRTFYMPHYAIGLFLDATAQMIPLDKLMVKLGLLARSEHPIM